jgi:hypothetical protein
MSHHRCCCGCCSQADVICRAFPGDTPGSVFVSGVSDLDFQQNCIPGGVSSFESRFAPNSSYAVGWGFGDCSFFNGSWNVGSGTVTVCAAPFNHSLTITYEIWAKSGTPGLGYFRRVNVAHAVTNHPRMSIVVDFDPGGAHTSSVTVAALGWSLTSQSVTIDDLGSAPCFQKVRITATVTGTWTMVGGGTGTVSYSLDITIDVSGVQECPELLAAAGFRDGLDLGVRGGLLDDLMVGRHA